MEDTIQRMKMFNIGNGARRLLNIFIVVTGLLINYEGLAIDGDVEYSAPYIMVDPETGQIVTVNPGPRLKAHEAPEEMAAQDTTRAGTAALTAARTTGTLENRTIMPPDTLPVIIAVLACLFMVVTGSIINHVKGNRGT